MYSGILVAIIGVLISLYITAYSDTLDRIVYAGMSAVLGFFIGSLLLGVIISEMAPRVSQNTSTVNIVSIRTGDGVEGTFFLGTGTINGYPMYTYFRQQSDGGYVQETIPAHSTVVYEDMTDRRGTIETYDDVIPESWKWRKWTAVTIYRPSYYRVHIPKGSIMRNFELR